MLCSTGSSCAVRTHHFSIEKISTVMRRQIKCNATTQTIWVVHIEYNEMCNGSSASVAIIMYGAEPMYTRRAKCNNNNGTYMCVRICTTLNFIVYLLRCFPSSIIIKFLLAHIHRTHLPHTLPLTCRTLFENETIRMKWMDSSYV